MKKRIACLLAICLVLSGCTAAPSVTAATEAVAVPTAPEETGHPSIALSLPEGFALAAEEGGNQTITNDTDTIGGIRRYKAPDYAYNISNLDQWLKDMGLPQLNDGIDRDRMIGGSINADWEASFYHPQEGETRHYFFIREDSVTEVWFHRDKIHPDVMQTILESVTFDEVTSAIIGIPAKAALSEEAYDLYKCRAVLEELQAQDAYKVHTLKENMQTGTSVSDSTYWRSGDRWMRSDVSPNGPVWSKNGNGEDAIPWLFSYQWNGQEVAHTGTTLTDEGKLVNILVMDAYDDQSDDSYYVEFAFDSRGVFQKVTISAFYPDAENYFTDMYKDTIQVLSLDKETIDQQLDAQ